MKGFRKINGANWLNEAHYRYEVVPDSDPKVTAIGKLPLHWNKVRNILLNNH